MGTMMTMQKEQVTHPHSVAARVSFRGPRVGRTEAETYPL